MTDFTRLAALVDELRLQVEQLAEEVRRLEKGAFDQSKVIPPTKTDDPDSIVGGRITRDFPDCCAVGDDSRFFCTGTLIAPNVVITAKHCHEPPAPPVTRVFLKGNNIDRPDDGETIRVAAVHLHPDANVDLAVLVLEQAATIPPRHIAQGPEVDGQVATLAGFGKIDVDGLVGYGRKRRVDKVPIATLGCEDVATAGEFGCHPGIELVAGHRGLNKDSCKGDSGGPLYIESATGLFYLLGATSRGVARAMQLCGDGGVYVRVDQFIDWITTTTGAIIEGPRI